MPVDAEFQVQERFLLVFWVQSWEIKQGTNRSDVLFVLCSKLQYVTDSQES